DHTEAIALYRSNVVGALLRRELEHGDLSLAFTELSQQRFCAPNSHGSRTYSVATLERWYYAFKQGGLPALSPKTRSDKGRGRVLTDVTRALLLDIRREHPSASVPLIVSTLEAEGRIERGVVSYNTVRRLFVQAGLDRRSMRARGAPGGRGKVRLRWQAEHPGALWHGDVCHVLPIQIDGVRTPVRIHALLDDASRFILAIEARTAEREIDMLALMVRALRRHGAPDALYLDNGSTYRGETLAVACGRLGVALIHAKPYDAPARGKMERFWRTLREGCIDHCGSLASLHDLNVRIYAWIDEHYHRAPHAGLLGATPHSVYSKAEARAATSEDGVGIDEQKLRDALVVRERRRVRRDNTLAMDGEDWETTLHFLAGQLVFVGRCLVEPDEAPWLEHEGKRHPLTRVDPIANGKKRRSPQCLDIPHPARRPSVPFDPPKALLDKAIGRRPVARRNGESEGGR
ncbi:MAG: DDE-type integrase/transposase/recombinase, partial [Solirubrobacterales bacterium]